MFEDVQTKWYEYILEYFISMETMRKCFNSIGIKHFFLKYSYIFLVYLEAMF